LKVLCLNHGMQARTAAILPFLLRMLLLGILFGHDNQASISDPGRHFVRHFALKRRFRNEMDFSRPVASTTNRGSILISTMRTGQLQGKYDKAARILWNGALSCVNETNNNFCYHICG